MSKKSIPTSFEGEELRRLFACLQACAGITTADLEARAVAKLVEASEKMADWPCGSSFFMNAPSAFGETWLRLRAALKPFAGMKGGKE